MYMNNQHSQELIYNTKTHRLEAYLQLHCPDERPLMSAVWLVNKLSGDHEHSSAHYCFIYTYVKSLNYGHAFIIIIYIQYICIVFNSD